MTIFEENLLFFLESLCAREEGSCEEGVDLLAFLLSAWSRPCRRGKEHILGPREVGLGGGGGRLLLVGSLG